MNATLHSPLETIQNVKLPNFSELNPDNSHTCSYCKASRFDMGERPGYYCSLLGIRVTQIQYVSPNDCESYDSIWQNDYRRRYDLERELLKKEGGNQ